MRAAMGHALKTFWDQRQPREQGLLVLLGWVLVLCAAFLGWQALVEDSQRLSELLPALRADVERIEAAQAMPVAQGRSLAALAHRLNQAFPTLELHEEAHRLVLHWRGQQVEALFQALNRAGAGSGFEILSADIERRDADLQVELVLGTLP